MALMIVVGTAALVMMVILTVIMVAERWVRGTERLVGGLAAATVIFTQGICSGGRRDSPKHAL